MVQRHDTDDIFIHLVFGLQAYAEAHWLSIPNSLRRALNALSFAQPDAFPKTLTQFIALCHEPVSTWYPYPVPDAFNTSQPFLYDNALGEESEDYYLALSDKIDLKVAYRGDVPQTALDNRIMIEFRERLRGMPNQIEAQELYVTVRSFLISNSWATLDQLRDHPSGVTQELFPFYEEMQPLHVDRLPVCDRCGLLERRNERWQGVKPKYCADHGSGSPHVHWIAKQPQLYQLNRGTHLRTFIPGRVELELFAFADELYATYPDHLLSPERYPSLDTYDLRLSFGDGEAWAVDAKDHAIPERLAPDIKFPYGEGDLAYNRCFFVIPNKRFDEIGYRERLENAIGEHPSNLMVISVGEFQSRVEDKVKSLVNPQKSRKEK